MSPLIEYRLLPHVPRSAGAAEERGVHLEFCAFPTRGNGHFRGAAGSALTAADRGTCLGVLVEGDRVWVAERRADRHAVGRLRDGELEWIGLSGRRILRPPRARQVRRCLRPPTHHDERCQDQRHTARFISAPVRNFRRFIEISCSSIRRHAAGGYRHCTVLRQPRWMARIIMSSFSFVPKPPRSCRKAQP